MIIDLMIGLDNKIWDVKDWFKNFSMDYVDDFDLVEEWKLMEDDINKSKEEVMEILERVIR